MPRNDIERRFADRIERLMRLRKAAAQYNGKLPQELEWLVDNGHMLADVMNEAGFRGRRRELSAIYGKCLEFLDGNADISAESMIGFFSRFELTEGELDDLPNMLKLGLIEKLSGHEKAMETALSEHRSDPDTAAAVGSVFTRLRRLSTLDLTGIRRELSCIEKIYLSDPSDAYAHMDEQSRAAYRRETAVIAKKHGLSEQRTAETILSLARSGVTERTRHVGYYIFVRPMGESTRSYAGALYAAALIILPAAAAVPLSSGILSGVLLWLILFDITKQLADRTVLSRVRTKFLPSMDPDEPIPENRRVICAVASIISSKKDVEECMSRLEDHFLASGTENMCFALLADMQSTKKAFCDGDKALLDLAAALTGRLNSEYGAHFILLSRERRYSESEQMFIPRERKRGAVMALARLCLGRDSELSVLAGTLPRSLRYCIILDRDTTPVPGALRELAAAMRHPLNLPEFSENGVVSGGHGILQPRLSEFPQTTRFASLFSGNGGTDIYGGGAPELYQALCGRTSFCGKGIIDMDAYLRVMEERLPRERILSHDLLEGCYLNSGYAPRAEFLDGFPSNVQAYLKREHRWIRGDWQLLPWLMHKVPTEKGRESNPLGFWDRLRIFDNLRRSLLCPALLSAFLLLPFGHFLPSLAAVICIFLPFLLSDRGKKELYASPVLPPARHALAGSISRLILLPAFAWIDLSAISAALYRMLITRRRLLEWTTASQSENSAGKIPVVPLTGIFAAVFIILPVFNIKFTALRALLAAAWLFSAKYAAILDKKDRDPVNNLTRSDREWLISEAAKMYSFFRDNMNAENSYLPPDNIQFRPNVGTAHRTSPTNIGLGLVSLLAASDMGIAEKDEILTMISRTVDTLETMEKWHGQIFNWYDTRTALPLYPRTVSTVDSGNLLACLSVLHSGLTEYGDSALAARVRNLRDSMDLRPLYDGERHLFRLGWNVETDRAFDGWYDMLESEARLTSYSAAALGAVPVRHWQALGRQLGESDGRRGLISWSGTMFEYLMPALFMSEYPRTLLYESSRYAVYCQRARTGRLFGISESCFFAFDGDMNYRYKAHGVQAAGFKRGLDSETVLSPYSAWLALTVDCENGLKCLREYEKMDMSGIYGFYEAADFTPSRLPSGRNYMPVRCFMAHHLGMSMTAAANVLCGGVMVKRFMSEPRFRAFRPLLMERLPVGVPVRALDPPAAEPSRRSFDSGDEIFHSGSDYSIADPNITVMSNGSFRVMLTDTGLIRVMSGMRDIARFDDRSGGVNFFFAENGRLHGLTPAPLFQNSRFSSNFAPDGGILSMENETFRSDVEVFVSPDDVSCVFSASLTNLGSEPLRGELIFCLEPVLDRQENFSSHPAFSKLFLSADRSDGGVLLSRRRRGSSQEWYAFAACDRHFRSEISRETAFRRSGYYGLAASGEGDISAPDPICVLRVPVELLPNAPEQIKLSLSCGNSPEDARSSAINGLALSRGAASRRLMEIITLMQLDPSAVSDAFTLYSDALFITSRRATVGGITGRHGRDILWRHGISGDLPIIFAEFSQDEGFDTERLIQHHMFLHLAGAYCDLILVTDDGGGYMRPQYSAAAEITRRFDAESLLDMNGGIHIIDRSSLEDGELRSIMAFCGAFFNSSCRRSAGPIRPAPIPMPAACEKPRLKWDADSVSFLGRPERIWSHTLSNESFGWLAADGGCGNMWYLNSRENRINPWRNDPIAPSGPESLTLRTVDGDADLFDGEVMFAPGTAQWRHEHRDLTLTAFVCRDLPARVFIIEGRSLTPGARLIWHTELQLGESTRDRRQVITHSDSKRRLIYAENPSNSRYAPYVFGVCSSPPALRFTCDEYDHMQNKFSLTCGGGMEPCIAMELPFEKKGDSYRAVIVCGCAENAEKLDFLTRLCVSADEELEKVRSQWRELTCDLSISTPEPRLDRFINGFAMHQIISGRLFSRSSVYQSSGAYGFRDQLQDVLSLLSAPPDERRYALVRRHLLRAAARQYEEGDVQHWWHEDRQGARGVRTRVTDDLLFLPFTAIKYVRVTNDRTIMGEKIPYLHDEPLRKGENERLNSPIHTEYRETLWDHCRRAMDLVIKRGTGGHGLALLGGGDWNDAMNGAGIQGRGESLWLTWFASMVSDMMWRFSKGECAEYHEFSEKLLSAAYNAWDGEWFLRGWHDNGSPIGSSGGRHCRIDAISQAFSVFADADSGDDLRRTRRLTALESAYRLLPADNVVRLFTPPFDADAESFGYISAYPPGIRENGGQYTHGAVWLGMAMLRAGLRDKGEEILAMLLPSERGAEYRAEPFYLAADVYSGEGIQGMAGWTVYTGAAGWYYTAAVRELLGLHFYRDRLEIQPAIPDKWQGFKASLKQKNAVLQIEVRRGERPSIAFDGMECSAVALPLSDGEHKCEVVI